MRRIVFIIGIIVLLLIPVIVFVMQRRTNSGTPPTTWPLIQASPTPQRYSVESQLAGYTLTLMDTRYLDSVAENIGIFKPEAVLDPEVYHGGQTFHHTISHIRLVLVPAVQQFLVAVPGRKVLASTADYIVEGDTLVLRVTINPSEQVNVAAGQHTLEDAFLRAAMQAMYYAHGLSDDPTVNANAFANIQNGIKDYLYIGVLAWPIQIERLSS